MPKVDRFQRLRSRRLPFDKRGHVIENFEAGLVNEDYKYLVGAMQPIEASYTENTFREAERVRSQLSERLPSQFLADFDYQGSVTSDTHIRVYSDIDLLVFHGRFVSLDPGALNFIPYQGNTLSELTSLRHTTAAVLTTQFPAANLDAAPGKALKLSGGSLSRKIDIIIGNWWNTELYKTYPVKMARGINILDSKIPREIRNKPFYHNFRLNDKDEKTGGLRKAVRLLKTIKYDAEPELQMSSYDIASLAYNMSDSALTVRPGAYLQLARNVESELRRFILDNATREALLVPNGMRKLFCDEGATLSELRALHSDVVELLNAIARSASATIINFSEQFETPSRPWAETRPTSVRAHSF